jgi:hypothetical protein
MPTLRVLQNRIPELPKVVTDESMAAYQVDLNRAISEWYEDYQKMINQPKLAQTKAHNDFYGTNSFLGVVTVGTQAAGAVAADLKLATKESTVYEVSTFSADYGTYYDNTMQLGFNCAGGAKTISSDVAWYLQWENKFLSGANYICEWHLNYIGTDGTQRRLLSAEVDRATHVTGVGVRSDSFYYHNDSGSQIFDITAAGKVGINNPAPTAALDVVSPATGVASMRLCPPATVNPGDIIFTMMDDTQTIHCLSMQSGDSYYGHLTTRAPAAQTNGSAYHLAAGSGKTSQLALSQAGQLVVDSSSSYVVHYYRDGVFMYDTAASSHLDFQIWQGELYLKGNSYFGNAANGQSISIKTKTELTTIAAAASTDTTITMPAGSIVMGVSVRVTTAIPTAATFTVGDSGSAARFSTAAVGTAANSTDVGTKAGAYYNASALAVRITPNLTPASNTGRVRVSIHYIEVIPPTS